MAKKETAIIPSDLSANQQRAIELAMAGNKDQEVAEAVGVTRETVCRWRHQPEFRAALNAYRKEVFGATRERLRDLATEAVEALAEGLADENPKVRVQAAVHILKAAKLYGERLPPIGPTTAEAVIAAEKQGDLDDLLANLRS